MGWLAAGQLSPLLNDPYYKTIGIGTRIFLGGGTGYVAWNGTQHFPGAQRNEKGIPIEGAGTLSVIGDLKQMNARWLVGSSVLGYGASLMVGIGIPIPILSEEILAYTAVTDADISAPVIDYADAFPNLKPDVLGYVTYAELKSGKIRLKGKDIPVASRSSYSRALEIAGILKEWITSGNFEITQPVAPIPGPDSGIKFHPLNERPIE